MEPLSRLLPLPLPPIVLLPFPFVGEDMVRAHAGGVLPSAPTPCWRCWTSSGE